MSESDPHPYTTDSLGFLLSEVEKRGWFSSQRFPKGLKDETGSKIVVDNGERKAYTKNRGEYRLEPVIDLQVMLAVGNPEQ